MMDAAVLIARLILATAFGLGGITKLIDLPGTISAMRNFGFPRPLAALVGIALPLAELAVAGAFLTSTWVGQGGLGAVVLTLAFVVGAGLNMLVSREPSTRFPGHLVSRRVGLASLVRLTVLGTVAAFVYSRLETDAAPSLLAWIKDLSTIERVTLATALLALALAAAVAWLTNQLLRQSGRVLVRLEALEAVRPSGTRDTGMVMSGNDAGEVDERAVERFTDSNRHRAVQGSLVPRIGEPAPSVTLPSISGRADEVQDLQGQPMLVLFWNPECRFCKQMLDDLLTWEADPPPGAPRLLIISTGPAEMISRERALRAPVLLDERFVAGRAFGASGTPSAVVVDAEGRIASEVAIGAEAILALARADTRTVGSAA